MSTTHKMTAGDLSFEDIERAIQRARRMRSQALADMGTALGSFFSRWSPGICRKPARLSVRLSSWCFTC